MTQQGFHSTVEQLLYLSCRYAIAIGKIVGGKGMDVADAHLHRHSDFHIVDANRDGVWLECKLSVFVHSSTKGEGERAIAHNINREYRSLRESSQDTSVVELALLRFLLLLAFLLAEDDASQPIETTSDFADNSQLAERRLCLAFLVTLALLGFCHFFLCFFHSSFDGRLFFFH